MQTSQRHELAKNLSEFFKRDLISIPLVKSYPHSQVSQRCGLKAATLELDTAGHPNIEYIAGNRLSVYPPNPADQVQAILRHVQDDISGPAGTGTGAGAGSANKQLARPNQPWTRFVQAQPRGEALKMALGHLFDISTPPSRDLLMIMADCCSNREHKNRLLAISRSDETWERWICQSLRTLKSTLDEFSSCTISAKRLFSELNPQQPRQYSISSIKSSNRFRTEIVVLEHKFDAKHIASSLQALKEREKIHLQDELAHVGGPPMGLVKSSASEVQQQQHQLAAQQPQATMTTSQNLTSFRSIRSMVPSPISSQQVERVPSFSGPVTSMYAMGHKSLVSSAISSKCQPSNSRENRSLPRQPGQAANNQFEGLCSNYLLSLQANESIVCEFVENPRFTLKGNRERPIMMIGQDIGVIAFRPFWQQRVLEHDRAQVFYTLFKDLKQKKFGDMQLVCLIGNKARVEDLFKHEINSILTHKIISSATYLNKRRLVCLLEEPLSKNYSNTDKELLELGTRMAKLLIESNGCLYTCCDSQMTQAIEILLVESIARLNPRNASLTKDRIMTNLMPKWKGSKTVVTSPNPIPDETDVLFALKNYFERAQIVQEIYDSSI